MLILVRDVLVKTMNNKTFWTLLLRLPKARQVGHIFHDGQQATRAQPVSWNQGLNATGEGRVLQHHHGLIVVLACPCEQWLPDLIREVCRGDSQDVGINSRMLRCKYCVGSDVVRVGIWTFRVSGSAMCAMRPSLGLPGNVATGVMLLVITPVLASTHESIREGASSVAEHRSSYQVLGPLQIPPRNAGNGPPPGAGVGPGSFGDLVKKEEAGDLVQALSLLQNIMSPEDFAKYQGTIAPKPKQKKTRE